MGSIMRFFEGCTALITGASAGFGAEFARQLAPHAHALVLVARRNDRLEALRDELEGVFPDLRVYPYAMDVADEAQRVRFVEWLGEQDISVDFLINNAGLGDAGSFDSAEWERTKQILEVNIVALTHLTHLILPLMHHVGRAAILNVSSVAGFFPLPNHAVYGASKAYVTQFSEALRMELKGSGISVTALCPGPSPTEFRRVAGREGVDFEQLPEEDGFSSFRVDPHQVVASGLDAVARDRARVIPGPLLSLAVAAALVVPFCLVRRWIEKNRHCF